MPDPAIRIRVGAAVDRDIGKAFRPLIDAAKDARRQVEDEMDRLWASVGGKGAAKAAQGPYRSVVRQAEQAANQVVNAEKRKQRLIEQEERKALRRRESAERYVARVKIRHFAEQQREEERADRLAAKNAAAARKENVGRLRGVAGGSVETLGKIGRGAMGVAGSIARGAGVQTDLGSYIGQSVELETRAAELSAAAYDEQRDKGKRLDPRELVAIARDVGREAAFDPARVLEGLQSFVGKTGDLATGRAALPALSKLARATGTSLEDMVGSAGEAAKALGEVGPGKAFETAEQKGKALVDVLRLIAGQGKVGAVELKDLAQYGGRLAAASQAFGGDAAANLGDMGALAQLAVARGGAASAAEAATAVAGFANTLKTPARVKEFKAHGVDVMDKGGGFRSVRDILKESSAAAVQRGGENAPLEFKKMFANVKGAQAADPAFQAYVKAFQANIATTKNKTEADKAGKAAIDALFDSFGKAVSDVEEKESFDRSMKTGAAQVQLFNNKLSEIGGQIAERVLPQLQKLAPYVVSAAEAFAKMVSFAAENPGTAIVAAITASIGKAAIGAAVSGAVSKLVETAGAKMTGTAAFALGAASIAITTATIVAQYLNEKKKTGYEDVKSGVAETDKLVTAAEKEFKEKGVVSAETMAKLDQARSNIMATQAEAQKYQELGGDTRYYQEGLGIAGGAAQAFDVIRGKTTFEDIGRGAAAQDQMRNLELMRASIDAMKEQMKGSLDKVAGTLKGPLTVQGNVTVDNPTGPQANMANTTK